MQGVASNPQRALFDRSCLSIISYLESFEECSNVEFSGLSKASVRDLQTWEEKNLPYKLPADMRAFYQLFDGFLLDFSADVSGARVSVGTLRLHSLAELVRVPIEGDFPDRTSTAGMSSAGFALDSKASASGGLTVLLYYSDRDRAQAQARVAGDDASERGAAPSPPKNSGSGAGTGTGTGIGTGTGVGAAGDTSYENPEVWYQDRSARWHFLSSSFSDYLRLMVVHAGVHGWQLAFTPEGLPPLTQQWMNLFSKERLIMDLNR
jgi:tubulin polyglutamylase complex subunit 2